MTTTYRLLNTGETIEPGDEYHVVARWKPVPETGGTVTPGFLPIRRLIADAKKSNQISKAAQDVLAERERQKKVEGWTEAHDDQHQNGELVEAASGYTQAYLFPGSFKPGMPSPAGWPWNESSWKPKDPRRNLVCAAALILAEIERLDR